MILRVRLWTCEPCNRAAEESLTFSTKNAWTTIHTSHDFSGHGQHAGGFLYKACGVHTAIAIASTSKHVEITVIWGVRHRKPGLHIRSYSLKSHPGLSKILACGAQNGAKMYKTAGIQWAASNRDRTIDL